MQRRGRLLCPRQLPDEEHRLLAADVLQEKQLSSHRGKARHTHGTKPTLGPSGTSCKRNVCVRWRSDPPEPCFSHYCMCRPKPCTPTPALGSCLALSLKKTTQIGKKALTFCDSISFTAQVKNRNQYIVSHTFPKWEMHQPTKKVTYVYANCSVLHIKLNEKQVPPHTYSHTSSTATDGAAFEMGQSLAGKILGQC